MAELLAVRPEQLDQAQHEQQKRYDLETQFAEQVDGEMHNDFELRLEGDDLIGEDGRSLTVITETSLAEAKAMVKVNPELWFVVRRCGFEKEEIKEAISMARGEGPNTMVIESDFPFELEAATEDIGGYNVRRKQTMQRILARIGPGRIRMYSQSLDGSDRVGLEAIYAYFGEKPKPGELLPQRIRRDLSEAKQANLSDELKAIYDRSLSARFGGEWYAGRRPADYRNTYDFVCQQADLINECLRLDSFGWLNEHELYKISATMQKRFDAKQQDIFIPVLTAPVMNAQILQREIETAGAQARQDGKSFSACGWTLRPDGLDGSTEDHMDQAGYGNKTGEDQYGSLKFKCTEGHDNIRPHGKLIDQCQHRGCKGKVKC